MGYGKIKMKKAGMKPKESEKKVDMRKVKEDAKKFMKMMKYKYGNFKMSYKVGGMKEVDAEKNPGLAKLPTKVRNKMGYKKEGGMKKKMGGGYKMKK